MLIDELEAVGIRLNAKKPDVLFKQKMAGGVGLSTMALIPDHCNVYCQVDKNGRENDSLRVAIVSEWV